MAVLDTGVAYANRGPFRRSPDLSRYGFVQGYDFVANTNLPNDRNGHGTFVASTIAEATNNHYGLTGLAFAARIMPVRVLDSQGEGEASTIAEGVRFAVKHGARVINLSLEFSSNVTASDIPELIEALRYARRRGSARRRGRRQRGAQRDRLPRAHARCDRRGRHHRARLPGGLLQRRRRAHARGARRRHRREPSGRPELPPERPAGRDVYQVTFTGSSPRRFGLPSGYEGTSMAAPRGGDRGADHRQPCARPPPHTRADHRAAAGDRTQARRWRR